MFSCVCVGGGGHGVNGGGPGPEVPWIHPLLCPAAGKTQILQEDHTPTSCPNNEHNVTEKFCISQLTASHTFFNTLAKPSTHTMDGMSPQFPTG